MINYKFKNGDKVKFVVPVDYFSKNTFYIHDIRECINTTGVILGVRLLYRHANQRD